MVGWYEFAQAPWKEWIIGWLFHSGESDATETCEWPLWDAILLLFSQPTSSLQQLMVWEDVIAATLSGKEDAECNEDRVHTSYPSRVSGMVLHGRPHVAATHRAWIETSVAKAGRVVES